MIDSKAEIDCHYTDDPVCPHCGHVQSDAWEWCEGDDDERECQKCDMKFEYSRHTFTYYSTRKCEAKE